MLLSTRTGFAPLADGLVAGADDFVSTPFHNEEVLARVSRSLHLARMRQAAMDDVEEQARALRSTLEESRLLSVAIGMVMGLLSISKGDATARLHSLSRSSVQHLLAVAASVIRRYANARPDSGASPGGNVSEMG
jgi:AmiR/NasT family two-component response regulator